MGVFVCVCVSNRYGHKGSARDTQTRIDRETPKHRYANEWEIHTYTNK